MNISDSATPIVDVSFVNSNKEAIDMVTKIEFLEINVPENNTMNIAQVLKFRQ